MIKRRCYLLSDTFQYRFVAVSFLYQFIVLLTFAGALFVPVGVHLEDATLSPSQIEEASKQFLVLHERVWVPLFVALMLLTLHSVRFSHRIAGPLYRFRAIFNSVAKGELTMQATIRKNDFLQKEAESLREMIEGLRIKIADIQASSGDVIAVFESLERAAKTGSEKEIRPILETLHKRVDILTTTVGRFKTYGEKPAIPKA